MLKFMFRRKRDLIPQAYRRLEDKETACVAGGVGPSGLDIPHGGGQGTSKDPNG